MDERKELIERALSGRFSVTELARAFEVSRKTAHKWIARHREGGMAALADRSHARLSGVGRLSDSLVDEIVSWRKRYPTWGPKKIAVKLKDTDPQRRCPAVSTIGEVLKRAGLVQPRRRRAAREVRRGCWPVAQAANEEWAIDYKGQWRLGDGSWSFPLTLSDSFSRYVLCCDSHSAVSGALSQRSLTVVFGEYGLPWALRMDRGNPFTSHGHGMSLTKLSIWWLKLDIELRRIEPGRPTQNARHERMHKELKAEVAKAPASNARSQQVRLNGFRDRYNHERPHEGLAMKLPAELYVPSSREFPSRLAPFDYPGHFERYRVRSNGTIVLRRKTVFVSEALSGEIIGLEQHACGWKVYLGRYLLADIDDEQFKILYIH